MLVWDPGPGLPLHSCVSWKVWRILIIVSTPAKQTDRLPTNCFNVVLLWQLEIVVRRQTGWQGEKTACSLAWSMAPRILLVVISHGLPGRFQVSPAERGLLCAAHWASRDRACIQKHLQLIQRVLIIAPTLRVFLILTCVHTKQCLLYNASNLCIELMYPNSWLNLLSTLWFPFTKIILDACRRWWDAGRDYWAYWLSAEPSPA